MTNALNCANWPGIPARARRWRRAAKFCLIEQGLTYAAIGDKLDMREQTVLKWRSQYQLVFDDGSAVEVDRHPDDVIAAPRTYRHRIDGGARLRDATIGLSIQRNIANGSSSTSEFIVENLRPGSEIRSCGNVISLPGRR